MILDSDVEAAIQSLIDNADKDAQRLADKIYVTEYRKVIKSNIMRENKSESVGAQEAIAYSDPRYTAHLEIIKEAVFQSAKSDFLRAGADAKIRAWQTQESSRRALKV
jgi:hypothetical protein|tara:strand:+ start:489 stop:812 length:324 start_codon:yes stop_codon:yes gene_type:complete